ncbi:MAG: N-6 DNA methylase [Fibrobacteria bacterium]|nr:N-6 DNA methylase [Fibrobacteria bacterium]
MSRPRRVTQELGYSFLQLEGGLFVPDQLEKAASGDSEFQKPDDYEILPGLKLSEEISRHFQIARALWERYEARRQRETTDPHLVTLEFCKELLHRAFGYEDLRDVGAVQLDERGFPIGQMVRGRVPLVVAPWTHGLDDPDPRFAIAGTGVRRKSPFQLAQEFLNASSNHLWALVTNGRQVRLLRDSAALTRPVWLELDLEQILTARDWASFTIAWRLLHASRAGRSDASPEACIWERWRAMGQETGLRVRDSLRTGVQEALQALGTGFLEHSENLALRQALDTGAISTLDYYQELLRLVYRLLFLFAVEERDLLHPEAASDTTRRLYAEGYAQRRLRERSLRATTSDSHHDLWESQRIVWTSLATGQEALGLPALGGLFAGSQCPHLDASRLSNASFLAALRTLRWSGASGTFASVDYRNMGPEELGSVYESLLELVPRVHLEVRRFVFAGMGDDDSSTKGNARKTTGSYYTPDSLVQELLKSALDPVIEARLAARPENPEAALLDLRVIDPSCGSGHFLLSASRRIAERLAQVRAPDGAVRPSDYRHALRDVISHCIHGVDRNPMAVELARTALWLESFEAERPLSFLDHHLVCGDALLGLMDLAVLERPIPDKAFAALSGDDKAVCKELTKRNKDAAKLLKKQADSTMFSMDLGTGDPLDDLRALDDFPDDTPADVARKEDAFRRAHDASASSPKARLADAWVGAFLLPKVAGNDAAVPTTQTLVDVRTLGGARRETQRALDAAQQSCRKARVLHWPLTFPSVFARGGFDVVLGNPPWERIKLQEEEFFATRHPLVAEAKNKAERAKRIEWLSEGSLQRNLFPGDAVIEGVADGERRIYEEFLDARRTAEAASVFFHIEGETGGRFPLTGVGDVNTYALFAESIRQILAKRGRAGFIVPTGIATDDSTKAFFGEIVSTRMLASFFDFENRSGIFPAIDSRMKFSLVTLGSVDGACLGFFMQRTRDLQESERLFELTADEFQLINPNTLTCPTFRSRQDAELTKNIYRKVPVLWREARDEFPEVNPWGIRFRTMFHMSNDSHLFRDEPGSDRLPLYEAKMIHQFDHRWATYAGTDEDGASNATLEQKQDPHFAVRPRYWVDSSEVDAKVLNEQHPLFPLFFAQQSQQRAELAKWFRIWLWGHELQTNPDAFDSSLRKDIDYTRIDHASVVNLVSRGVAEKKFALRMAERFPLMEAEQLLLRDQIRADVGMRTSDPRSLGAKSNEEYSPAWDKIAELLLPPRKPKWLMGFRDIARSTDERTVIANVLPCVAVGNNLPLMQFDGILEYDLKRFACLLANLDALVFDFVARHKVGGVHLNFFLVKQLPVFPPSDYTPADLDFIVERVLELTYTSWDLQSWAKDLGYHGEPFPYYPDRRAVLRAELDARYARLYGLTRDELRYILDPADVMGPDYPSETFRVLKERELRELGEYRTRRLVLEAWDREEQAC